MNIQVQYPEYDPNALFKCDQGCGTFRRDKCGVFRGRLHCPACRFQDTLSFTDRCEISKDAAA